LDHVVVKDEDLLADMAGTLVIQLLRHRTRGMLKHWATFFPGLFVGLAISDKALQRNTLACMGQHWAACRRANAEAASSAAWAERLQRSCFAQPLVSYVFKALAAEEFDKVPGNLHEALKEGTFSLRSDQSD
jgi:hypothetical protein